MVHRGADDGQAGDDVDGVLEAQRLGGVSLAVMHGHDEGKLTLRGAVEDRVGRQRPLRFVLAAPAPFGQFDRFGRPPPTRLADAYLGANLHGRLTEISAASSNGQRPYGKGTQSRPRASEPCRLWYA